MIKAVLFDLDNTLVDFMKMKRASCSAAVSAMVDSGLKIDKKKAMSVLFGLYDRYGIEYNLIFQKLVSKINKKIDYRILARGINAYRKVQQGFLEPYPNVILTLIRLREKGIKLAVVSDAPKLKAWMRLVELNLEDFFDNVVAFEDTGTHKPSPEPFEKALKLLKISADEALFVGDWPERDIKGAKELGIKTVYARYGRDKTTSGSRIKADYEINNIIELVGIVG
ncbi:TIGR02253 family HAD-type hydrolase [Candidatus Woesearchaeota archaeon]|nr:TIGR02253 family HAD-type hydrolase [Candidatus Woesearchaeota archaeon]